MTTDSKIPKKLVVVGDGASGKTSLLYAYCNNTFAEDYMPTIHETYITTVKLDDEEVRFALWDTAGEEDYDRLRPLSYPRTDLVIICFNVDNPISLQNIHLKWLPEVKHFCPSVPILLVATKLDLRYNRTIVDNLRKDNLNTLSYSDGLRTFRAIKAAGYLECSAKTMEGIKAVFIKAAEIVLQKNTTRNEIALFYELKSAAR
ncbi:hypothetical protein WA026_005214 [Henosepilachna vigintioctopunctata]|uniref:Rho GTPase n=1 Tax=Henosepilachna vigintioctopunctata TaxID=420089 RepID=A0AAW1UL93_9CUCU